MPKRSNDFQRFVRLIERISAGPEARVEESENVIDEKDLGVREVDVVIDRIIDGVQKRIAIECRDHSRKQDVTWIDAIVGKYQYIRVDQVVAVSRAGFTPGAQKKAAARGIRTFTLRQALEDDWASRAFSRLVIEHVEFEAHLRGIDIVADAPEGTSLEACLLDGLKSDGGAQSILEACNELFLAKRLAVIPTELAAHGIHPTSSAPIHFRIPLRFVSRGDTWIIAPDGSRHPLRELILHSQGIARLRTVDQQDYRYEERMATTASLSDDAGVHHRFTFVQSERNPELRAHYERTESTRGGTKQKRKARRKGRKRFHN